MRTGQPRAPRGPAARRATGLRLGVAPRPPRGTRGRPRPRTSSATSPASQRVERSGPGRTPVRTGDVTRTPSTSMTSSGSSGDRSGRMPGPRLPTQVWWQAQQHRRSRVAGRVRRSSLDAADSAPQPSRRARRRAAPARRRPVTRCSGTRRVGGAPARARRGTATATVVRAASRQPMPSRLSSPRVSGWSRSLRIGRHAVRRCGAAACGRAGSDADLWTSRGRAYRCGRLPAGGDRASTGRDAPDTPQEWCVGVQWILGSVNREMGAGPAIGSGACRSERSRGSSRPWRSCCWSGVLAIPLVKLGGVFDETRQHDQGRLGRDRPAAQRGHHHGDHDQRPAGPGRRDHLQRPGGHDQRLAPSPRCSRPPSAARSSRSPPSPTACAARSPTGPAPGPGARWPTRPGPSRPPRARRSGGRPTDAAPVLGRRRGGRRGLRRPQGAADPARLQPGRPGRAGRRRRAAPCATSPTRSAPAWPSARPSCARRWAWTPAHDRRSARPRPPT